MRAGLLCTVGEFWDRLGTLVSEYGFHIFEQHQRNYQIRSVCASKDFVSDVEWNVWLSQSPPSADPRLKPAAQSWILTIPPREDMAAKTVSQSELGVQTKYMSSSRIPVTNSSLSSLFKSVRKSFYRGTMYAEVTRLWEPKYRNEVEKMRFTRGAIELQNDGWSFRDWNGPLLLPSRDE